MTVYWGVQTYDMFGVTDLGSNPFQTLGLRPRLKRNNSYKYRWGRGRGRGWGRGSTSCSNDFEYNYNYKFDYNYHATGLSYTLSVTLT